MNRKDKCDMRNRVTYNLQDVADDRAIARKLTHEDWQALEQMDRQLNEMMREYELTVRELLGKGAYAENLADLRKHMQDVRYKSFGLYGMANR